MERNNIVKSKKTTVVDLGNLNIKTNYGVVFSARYTTQKQPSDYGESVIFYNDTKYYMEKGSLDKGFDKSKKDFIPTLLYAIEKSIDTSEINCTDLMLGLPIDQIERKDDIKNMLTGINFEYRYNGKLRSMKFDKVGIVAEGVSSYYTLDKDERSKDTMILDFGGRTVNVATFVNRRLEKKVTLPLGMMNYYQTVLTRESAMGKNYIVEEIERLINSGNITNVEDIKADFVDTVFKELRLHCDATTYNVYATGGGSLNIDKQLLAYAKENRIKLKLMENPLISNILGNEKIAQSKWGA